MLTAHGHGLWPIITTLIHGGLIHRKWITSLYLSQCESEIIYGSSSDVKLKSINLRDCRRPGSTPSAGQKQHSRVSHHSSKLLKHSAKLTCTIDIDSIVANDSYTTRLKTMNQLHYFTSHSDLQLNMISRREHVLNLNLIRIVQIRLVTKRTVLVSGRVQFSVA